MNIAITPEELRSTSANMKTDSSELTAIANRLNNEISNLMATWQGAAQSAFIEQYETQYKDVLTTQIPALVEGLATTLINVADNMETTDQDLANSIAS